MPKEGRFFDLFNEHGSLVLQGAIELNAFLADMGNREAHAQNVNSIEKKADKVTHETIQLLHQTFVTPLDRDDIHKQRDPFERRTNRDRAPSGDVTGW